MRFNKRSISTILSLTLASSSYSALVIHAGTLKSYAEFKSKYNSQKYLTVEYNGVKCTVQKRVCELSFHGKNILKIDLHYLSINEINELMEDFLQLIVNKKDSVINSFSEIEIIIDQKDYSQYSRFVFKPAVSEVLNSKNWFISIPCKNEGVIKFCPVKGENCFSQNDGPGKFDEMCDVTLNSEVHNYLIKLQSMWKKYFKFHNDIIKGITEIKDVIKNESDYLEKFDLDFVKQTQKIFGPTLDKIEPGLWDKTWEMSEKVSSKDFYNYTLLRNLSIYKALSPKGNDQKEDGDICKKIYEKASNIEDYEGCIEVLKDLDKILNEQLDKLKHYQAKVEKKKKECERQLKVVTSLGEIKIPSIHQSPVLRSISSAPPIKEVSKVEEPQISENVKEQLKQVSEKFRISSEILKGLGKKAFKQGLSDVCKKILDKNKDLEIILNIAQKFADKELSFKKNSWNTCFIQAFYHKGIVSLEVALWTGKNEEGDVLKKLSDLLKAIDIENEQLKKEVEEKEKIKSDEETKSKLSELKVSYEQKPTQKDLLSQLPDAFEDFFIVLNDIYDGIIFNDIDHNGNVQISLGKKFSDKEDCCKTQLKLFNPLHKIQQSVGKGVWKKAISHVNKKTGEISFAGKFPTLDVVWNEYCSKWCSFFVDSWRTNGYALKKFLNKDKKNLEGLIKTLQSQTIEIANFKEEQSKEKFSKQFEEKLSTYTNRMLAIIFTCRLNRDPKLIGNIVARLNDYAGKNFNKVSHSMFFWIWKDWHIELQKLLKGGSSKFVQFTHQNDLVQKVLKYKNLEDIQSSIAVFEEQILILKTMFPDIDESSPF